MEHLSVQIDAPDAGWPLVITIGCGGYVDQLTIISECETVPWRRVEAGHRLGQVIGAWMAGGGAAAVAEMERQTALSDARRGHS